MLEGQLIPESPRGIKHLLLNWKCNKWVREKIQSQEDFIQNLRYVKMCLALEKQTKYQRTLQSKLIMHV